jgi:hypothetical protein
MIAIEELSVLPSVPKKNVDEFVMLQVRVRESIRDRLKLQSVMLKESMGDLADRLLDEALNQLEKPTTGKDK